MRGRRRRPSSDFLDDDELYLEYTLAERLGKTVAELETGVPQPLSMQEFVMWGAYFTVKAYYEKRAREQNR